MSRRPIDRSLDLRQLRDEGYDIKVADGYLLMFGVPYLTAKREVRYDGVLAAKLDLANNISQPPDNHTILFAGEFPCDMNGSRLAVKIGEANANVELDGVKFTWNFSAKPKPKDNYDNFHHKFESYVNILGGPAQTVDPNATAKTFKPHRPDKEDSPFHYEDTASSRADIVACSEKMRMDRVDIIGCGGTAGHVLDSVAKTLVKEIHLWDGDDFLQHNAFRAPGAASGEDLEEKLKKVEYFKRVYSKMRNGIIPHPVYMDNDHLQELAGTKFVFLCMEGPTKKPIVEYLEKMGIPFIDVGMGVYVENNSIGGILRVTTSTPAKRDHVHEKKRISFTNALAVNEYDKNVQINELNALNAAFAVIRWKKLFGFYIDQEREHYMLYAVGGNEINNEDEE